MTSEDDFDKTKKYRPWCFTINNWTDDDWERLQQLPVKYAIKYLIYGKEICPTTGTPHLQGYVAFESPILFSSVRKKLPRARLIPAKGEAKANRVYCSKSNDFVEYGDMPQQGKRNDIDTIRDLIKEGAGMEQIVDKATSYQSMKTGEMLLKYKEKKRDFKPIVKWYYGATGTGKTRTANEENEGKRIYTAMETSRWFDGYDAHEVLIIDDMRRDFIKFHNLLKLLDRYEFRIETKGGSRQMLAKVIIITCPIHPAVMWEAQGEDIAQLIRRIDEIREFV